MKNYEKIIISAVVGGIVSVGTFVLVKHLIKKSKEKKSEDIPEDEFPEERPKEPEVELASESEFTEEITNPTFHVTMPADRVNYSAYAKVTKPYTSESDDISEDEEDNDVISKGIYGISADEYRSNPDYDWLTWYYYSDGIVTDQDNHVIHNYENYIGDFLPLIGECDPNVAYIRNDDKRCDYEILEQESSFADLIKEKPYLRRELEDHD